MPEQTKQAILIFTFGPVQGFISEARRAGDLYAGSRILVKLALAAAEAIGTANLIYPTLEDGNQDAPNKLVAMVNYDQAQGLVHQAETKIHETWRQFAAAGYRRLERLTNWSDTSGTVPPPDEMWQAIWERQLDRYWECYWAYAPYDGQNYHLAYNQASRALDAAKRTRCFAQAGESNLKDTLGGQRSALRLKNLNARAYWEAVAKSPRITEARVRPNGRERLDALGVVKRFGLDDDYQSFLSVGSVATTDFLKVAKTNAPAELQTFRRTVEHLLGDNLFEVRKHETEWPYDGDLFYLETLTALRLEERYKLINSKADLLEAARQALKKLQQRVGFMPSPYYAIIFLDGDSMGKLADRASDQGDIAHKEFSQKLSRFAGGVHQIVEQFSGHPIYSGGDDVFALAPISTALQIGQALQEEFRDIVGGTVSAGISMAHHLYPLDAAVRAAQVAERAAKSVEGKAAVAVRVLKRSGQTLEVRSKWKDIPPIWQTLATANSSDQAQAGDLLSARFSYEFAEQARVVTQLDAEARRLTLRRLLKRHQVESMNGLAIEAMVGALNNWADTLDNIPQNNDQRFQGLAELGRWLLLARFLAQRGGE